MTMKQPTHLGRHLGEHLGEILQDNVLTPLGLSTGEASELLGVTIIQLENVLQGHEPISDELANSLERAGISTARFWLALHKSYDLS